MEIHVELGHSDKNPDKHCFDGDSSYITGSVENTLVRLLGIDAPEIRGSSIEEGKKSRERLKDLILHKDITIETDKDRKGKYGRYLATVYLDDTNINQLMIKEGFAKHYEI